jgi:thiol:disulfide interchange protein DsbD
VLAVFLVCGSTLAAQEPEDTSPHSDAALVSEYTSVQPSGSFTVALYIAMDPGWHSYWINPGDAGMATSVEWELPAGFEAGDIQWPHPTKIDVPPLTSYGYFDELLLPVEITPPAGLTPGTTVTLSGRADWLICTEICLPAWAEIRLELPVADRAAAPDPVWSGLFAETRSRMPVAVEGWTLEAGRTGSGFDLVISAPEGRERVVEGAYFFAADEGVVAPSGTQTLARDGNRFVVSLVQSPYLQGPAETLHGVLLAAEGSGWDADGRVRAMAVDVAVSGSAAAAPTQEAAGATSVTLIVALVFALIGGVLLNLMPCVFPILSIKVLGFVHQGGEDRSKARNHGLAFGAGVVLSFLALAVLLLLLRTGGARLGWGFQLQSPAFVAVMAALFFVIALNLMGLFEVGTRVAGIAGRLAQPSGYADSFSSGVLATLVATPCTAPFMGTALGFALTQPTTATLLIFGSLGVGMALPYLILSAAPALLERLPRPGPWMETLKQLLAFPLFGTVIWLVWVFGLQTGMGGVAYLLSALMLLALATWILGRWPAALVSSRTRVITRTLALAAFVLSVVLVARGTRGQGDGSAGLDWEPFSMARVQELRASGQVVFVDFTAAWCITCQVNEQVILSSSTIRDAFLEYDVATLKADWTRFDSEITDALESFGRSGVPLYVLYPGDATLPAVVLPTILSKQGVLEALESLPGPTGPAAQAGTTATQTDQAEGR